METATLARFARKKLMVRMKVKEGVILTSQIGPRRNDWRKYRALIGFGRVESRK
jgi:hypothetical protein